MTLAQAQAHLKVQVWIASPTEGKVLILRMLPERGGYWQPVTGGVEIGEALVSAAAREAFEETGLNFQGPPQPIGYEFEFERQGSRVRESGFFLEVAATSAPRLDSREHTEGEWVSYAEALRRISFESNREMLRKWLQLRGVHA